MNHQANKTQYANLIINNIQDSRELVCEQLFEGAMEIMREFLETSTIHGIAHISTEKVKAICYNLIYYSFVSQS